jgi:N-acetylmuramoyl-L-alanine amidase
MAKLICLQSGHEGVTTGATGAPGEQELNVRIRNRLSQMLISKGFVVQLVNANPPQSEINKDFDLFLALHGDANIYGTGGGIIGYIDPAIDSSPESNAESKRIKEAIESQYFIHSGIVNHPERNNANITHYYMWSRLSAKTPCVLLEMGVVQDAHDKVILADTDIVANAIARGICVAYNVPFDAPVPPPVDPTIALNAKIKDLENKVNLLTIQSKEWQTKYEKLAQAVKSFIAGSGV